jgi:hypothetical protein
MPTDVLAIPDLRAIFVEEVEAAAGVLFDAYATSDRLLIRATLPWIADVRPGDPVQGGVAMRATLQEAVAHPFVVRQVCTNGAIAPQALATQRVERMDELSAVVTRAAVRGAARSCARHDVFVSFASGMAATARTPVTLPFLLMAMLPDQTDPEAGELYTKVMAELGRGGDRSHFGLMNALTAVGRETKDPELRWRLEELGGAVAMKRMPTPPRPKVSASTVSASK